MLARATRSARLATLVAYASWEEHVSPGGGVAGRARRRLRAEPPAFDPALSEAVRDHGRVPDVSGLGRAPAGPAPRGRASPRSAPAPHELTRDHPAGDGYGPGQPVRPHRRRGGQVLLLGAPLDTLTLLHHAEAIAAAPRSGPSPSPSSSPAPAPAPTRTSTRRPAPTATRAWAFRRHRPVRGVARAALEAGAGTTGRVAAAGCHLFDAAALTAFAVAWIEERFA